MSHAILLVLALCLDAALGEPRWLWSRVPHPAVLMGRLVATLDTLLNRAPFQRIAGVLALITMIVMSGLVGWLISHLGSVVSLVCAAVLLAHRSLIEHVGAVGDGLRLSLPEARRAVAMIVSRDVRDAAPSTVARSSMESLAENFSDGVVAPAFWFLFAGLPGILVYKMVNTADSMIGYRTERHEAFGWAAARCDDVLNWLPARLTALSLAAVGGTWHAWPHISADARRHRSPNAGWPEAALAYSLDVALAGPRSYDGQLQPLAWVNGSGKRDLHAGDIDAALILVWKAWGAWVAVLCIFGGVFWLF